MSDKQVAQAAVRGRSVTFHFLRTQPMHEVVGYVVGMDDYTWLVASTPHAPQDDLFGDGDISTFLVHKSVDLVRIDNVNSLDLLPTKLQAQIRAIGEPFWQSCTKNILSTPLADPEKDLS